MVIKAGFSFAIIVMLLVAPDDRHSRRPATDSRSFRHCITAAAVWCGCLFSTGCTSPILELMDGLHAYQGLLEYTQPLLEGISPALAVL